MNAETMTKKMDTVLDKARNDYEHIINGREGHWFDPGEHEDLKQRWFDTYALSLLESVEDLAPHQRVVGEAKS